MKHGEAKIVPKLLNFEQKQRRMDIAQEMLTMFNNDSDLLKRSQLVTHNTYVVYVNFIREV